MGKNQKTQGVGKSLIKKHNEKQNQRKNKTSTFKQHTNIDDEVKPILKSIIDQNSLEEFVQLAQLSNKKFSAEKEITIINKKEILQGSVESATAQRELLNNFLTESTIKNPQYQLLKIPRKPQWDSTMTAQEIQTRENFAFLQWRKDIASLEENNVNLAITPFEKNLEVWRQLWRVIEKSDILLQIVDARNPYFFYSQDLEKYIAEVNPDKEFMLLINKADYLTTELREHWSKYFNEKGVKHFFFSALEEQDKIDKDQVEEESEEDIESGEEGDSDTEKPKKFKQGLTVEEEKKQRFEKLNEIVQKLSTPHIFTRTEIMDILRGKSLQMGKTFDDRLMIGFVGYPNVGKSSVINVICQKKRVGVANMPGKTKHFQTLNMEDNMCLCDCPGLVFPSFTNSKAEMMCCGVLPIDTMKDYVSPISLIINRVPREVLESYYKVHLPPKNSKKYTASIFLSIYGAKKGYVTGRGIPNEAQAARIVLKDYNSGKLLFVHLRPDYILETHGPIQQSGFHDTRFQVLSRDTNNGMIEQSNNNQIDEETKSEQDNEDDSDDFEDDDEDLEETKDGSLSLNTDLVSSTTGPIAVSSNNIKVEIHHKEDLIDKQFFVLNQQVTELKLNKGEKRALKFAILRGVKIDEIPNLKEYLGEQVKQMKAKKTVRGIPIAKKTQNGGRGGNNSNKFYAFAELDNGNESD
eukprot:403357921